MKETSYFSVFELIAKITLVTHHGTGVHPSELLLPLNVSGSATLVLGTISETRQSFSSVTLTRLKVNTSCYLPCNAHLAGGK